MIDPDALREALAGLAERWDEYGGPYPDEAVIVAAARELLASEEIRQHISDIMFDPLGSPDPECELCKAGIDLGIWARWDVDDPFGKIK